MRRFVCLFVRLKMQITFVSLNQTNLVCFFFRLFETMVLIVCRRRRRLVQLANWQLASAVSWTSLARKKSGRLTTGWFIFVYLLLAKLSCSLERNEESKANCLKQNKVWNLKFAKKQTNKTSFGHCKALHVQLTIGTRKACKLPRFARKKFLLYKQGLRSSAKSCQNLVWGLQVQIYPNLPA